MAKIDISKIEGYADMSAEEKLAALEALDLPEPDYTGYVKKDVLDKATSEAAGLKRQLREKMTQDEQAAQEQAERLASMEAELETLRQEKTVADLAKRWVGVGYPDELATSTAKAMAAGEIDTVFKNHAKFIADREKALRAELLKDTPTPPAGEGGKGMTKEKFRAMSLAEKQAFAQEHAEEYAALFTPATEK